MKILQNVDEKAWDDFVVRNEGASFFHLSVWKRIIEQSFGFQPHYICAKDQEGRICGVLPLFFINSRLTGKRLVSLPFSYICGPLGDSRETVESLIKEGLRIFEKTGSDYFEIKATHREEVLQDLGFHESASYRTYIVRLTDQEQNWRKLHKSSTQRSINKAKKENVRIQFTGDEESLKQFYRLNLGTSRYHGIPPQPYGFLKNVWDILVQDGLAKLVLAEYQKRPVAAAFFFLFEGSVYYLYGASDPEYLFCRPNHLLLWETMLWAMENNYGFFDLGRVSHDNVGLAEFKKRWGAEQRDLYYYYWPQIKGVGAIDREGWKYRLATRVWKKMPVWMTGKGAFLYKHLG